jgi:formylmethanofuran dehydrogenase subunit A
MEISLMLTKLKGGRVYDPAHGINGEVIDIYVRDGRIVALGDTNGAEPDHEFNCSGKVIMAGAIDLHTHIGGGKVTIARNLLPEDHRGDPVKRSGLKRAGVGHAVPSTLTTGYRYAEMGYTAAFEPAILPNNARQAHMEMADVPLLDVGGYVILGSDDFFLRLLSSGVDQEVINNYVAWTIHSSHTMGVKVVNPGGISAFKFNQRTLDLDESHTYYGVTPRKILQSLARAVYELGVPFPLHVHGCNLGVPGNIETTLNTMAGVEGLPMHLTHIQFHSYGTEGDRKFSSGAAQIAEAINKYPNISVDVGQIMFGQTVTASGDSMSQYRNRGHAHPNKWVCMDIECDEGCGVVPFKYRDQNFVNALQWCIGLEIFLLAEDPWRIFLTTDHPNGAPFTTYPHLIRLLMDKSFRNDMLSKVNPDAAALSTLGSITREYSLYEIAILTRAGAARTLGLRDRGHLGIGAAADITVYTEQEDREAMFTKPDYVFKDGDLVVKNGEVVKIVWGNVHTVKPEFDRQSIESRLRPYFDRYLTMNMDNFIIRDWELEGEGRSKIMVNPCKNA